VAAKRIPLGSSGRVGGWLDVRREPLSSHLVDKGTWIVDY